MGDNQVNSWMTQVVLQRTNQVDKMRSLPSDWWMGWVMEREVLEEFGQRTGSEEDVHLVQYLMEVAVSEKTVVGVKKVEGVEVDKEH